MNTSAAIPMINGLKGMMRLKQFLGLGVVVILIVIFISILSSSKAPATNFGALATSSAHGNIPIFASIDLTGKSAEEILAVRRSIISRTPLLQGEYGTSRTLLEQIDPAARWFSTVGFYAIGENPASLHGPTSKEGSQLLNPGVLVYPEIIGLSIWDARGVSWNLAKAPLSGLSGLPLMPKLSGLTYDRGRKLASVHVNARAYILEAEQFSHTPLPRENITFMASALNARDLGFAYGKLNTQLSENQQGGPKELVEFKEEFGHFPDCYGAGACNFLPLESYSFPEIKLTALPALVHFDLWREKPASDDQAPDYSFKIFID